MVRGAASCWLLAISFAGAGCVVSIDYDSSSFRCERDAVCPDGLVCRADGFCGAPLDAGSADAPPQTGQLFGPGSWAPTPDSPLAPRAWIDALWTGSHFLIFGGAIDTSFTSTNTGALYDPNTQQWTEISTTGAPPARHTTLQVWTGTEALYYGGAEGQSPTSGGGRYNPSTDEWAPMSNVNGPGERIYGSVAWIGDRMMVWGGWDNDTDHVQTGFLYDPATDEWTAMSTVGAPSPRSFTSLIWTGQVAIVWGGCSGPMGACPDNHGDGAIYDPSSDKWTPMSADGAPVPRSQHSAVWNGTEMLLFGGATAGNTSNTLDTGYAYNPTSDSWRPLSTSGGPSPRADHAAFWIVDKMLIWGSSAGNTVGYLYDPVADNWALISSTDKPSPRSRFADAVTPDGRLFIWGGEFSDGSGGVWTPSSN